MSDQGQGCPHPYEDADGRATACPQCAAPGGIDRATLVLVDRAVLARAVEAMERANRAIKHPSDCAPQHPCYLHETLAELRPLLVKR